MKNSKSEGGVQYWPTDWSAKCEAKCRKTGKQCPHTCSSQIPNHLAGGCVAGPDWYSVQGRPVNLCNSHWLSWHKRGKRLLTLPLIDGGHLSPYNQHGFGSMIVAEDRIDFSKEPVKARVPREWGWIGWRGKVPEGLLERIPQHSKEYVVGLPDTQGGMCWLAGYDSDPTRYYTDNLALVFTSRKDAEEAIKKAKLTHPTREREYRIIPKSEMAKYNTGHPTIDFGSNTKSRYE